VSVEREARELDIKLDHGDIIRAAISTLPPKSCWVFPEFTPFRVDLRFDLLSVHQTTKRITGFECKSNRCDWISDSKWERYKDYCNEFYVVAPKGVVHGGEISPGVGYIEVATVARRSVIIRKGESKSDAQERLKSEPWKHRIEAKVVVPAVCHQETLGTEHYIPVLEGIAYRRNRADQDDFFQGVSALLIPLKAHAKEELEIQAERIQEWLGC